MLQGYKFALVDVANSRGEDLGAMGLRGDDDALDFARSVISDLLAAGPALYAGWRMFITEGERVVAELPVLA